MSAEAKNKKPFQVSHQLALLGVLVGLILLFGIIEPAFFIPRVFFDIFAIAGEIGIMALAMTYVITTGGVDLAVGYNLQMSAIVFGITFVNTGNVVLSIIFALIVATLGGMFNGFIVAKTKIPPLVTTLGTMYLFRGISMIIAGTATYSGFPDGFKQFSTFKFFNAIPIQLVYFVVLFFIMDYFYRKGSLGRNLKGMGFNENAVRFSGVKVDRIKFWIYTLLGLLCGFAAMVYLGRLSAAKTSMGDFMNFQVITAVLLGGTSIMGGVGSVRGTFIATLIIGVLHKGFSLLNFSGNIYNFTIGLILIFSLILYTLTEERRKVKTRSRRDQLESQTAATGDSGSGTG
ncbi:MAG: ABC transporter permease [Spirochaetales bacterium]|nr:ABC transporter permease [Spirochaetales bacterium]MCF7938323.1 ABC transporter permease [Spirochaetales bacterium]